MSLISLFIGSILSDNIILNKMLGVNSLLNTSNDEKGLFSISIINTLTVVLSSLLMYLLYRYILVPNNIEYFNIIISFILILLSIKVFAFVIKKFNNKFSSENYLSLILTNSALYGIIFLNIENDYNLIKVLTYTIGSIIGYLIVTYILMTIQERLDHAPIIKGFKGLPIVFITLFIMSLVFTRYIAG